MIRKGLFQKSDTELKSPTNSLYILKYRVDTNDWPLPSWHIVGKEPIRDQLLLESYETGAGANEVALDVRGGLSYHDREM